MKKTFLVVILVQLLSMGCATTNQHLLKVDSTPSDALISVHDKKESSTEDTRKVAGTTPIEKNFDFPSEGNRLWLEIEKRGYVPQRVEVTPETRNLTVNLERLKDKSGEPVREYTFPPVNRLLLAIPDFEVIKRGFSSEEVSKDESAAAKSGLAKGTHAYFKGKYEVVQIEGSQDDTQLLKSAWRDVRTAMELIDPIRLKYLSTPQHLETKGSREAARQLGSHYGAEALLVLSGKQNLETTGMVLGKVGLSVAGTAASYGSAYSNAVSRGDSFFVYTVYVPRFSEGTLINAALIDCTTGEILWLNRGLWGPVNFNEPEAVREILKDLLTGLR
jgi:hypothetical protein